MSGGLLAQIQAGKKLKKAKTKVVDPLNPTKDGQCLCLMLAASTLSALVVEPVRAQRTLVAAAAAVLVPVPALAVRSRLLPACHGTHFVALSFLRAGKAGPPGGGMGMMGGMMNIGQLLAGPAETLHSFWLWCSLQPPSPRSARRPAASVPRPAPRPRLPSRPSPPPRPRRRSVLSWLSSQSYFVSSVSCALCLRRAHLLHCACARAACVRRWAQEDCARAQEGLKAVVVLP